MLMVIFSMYLKFSQNKAISRVGELLHTAPPHSNSKEVQVHFSSASSPEPLERGVETAQLIGFVPLGKLVNY